MKRSLWFAVGGNMANGDDGMTPPATLLLKKFIRPFKDILADPKNKSKYKGCEELPEEDKKDIQLEDAMDRVKELLVSFLKSPQALAQFRQIRKSAEESKKRKNI